MAEQELNNVIVDEVVTEQTDDENLTTDTTVDYLQDDFITEENLNAFKLMNLKSQMKDIESISSELKSKPGKYIVSKNENDDIDGFLDEKLESLTEDQIKTMSDDELNEVLTFNGETIQFTIEFETDDKKNEFIKDYLIFRKQATEATKKFDDEIKKINEEIAASQEEFDELNAKFGNLNNLIKDTLNKKYESAETEEKKELFKNLIESFDYALTLDNVKEYVKSWQGKRILGDFKFPKSSMSVYRRYKKVLDFLKITSDLKDFNNFEKKFLGDAYAKRPNILMFTLMHFIASYNNKLSNRALGLFITQFIVNAKNLIYNKFDNDDDKTTFVNSLKEIIDIIG